MTIRMDNHMKTRLMFSRGNLEREQILFVSIALMTVPSMWLRLNDNENLLLRHAAACH